jgi:hypothetical protein
MGGPREGYTEHGGTWRPLWIVAGALAVFLLLDLVLPGGDLPPLMWVVAVMTVLGIVAAGCRSARRMWTVRVDDHALTVGRERVALSDIDGEHLRAVDSGVDAGAPVLGGGWSLPRGRTGLPLRLAGGRTVLAPTRDPVALRAALLAALSSSEGTLEP